MKKIITMLCIIVLTASLCTACDLFNMLNIIDAPKISAVGSVIMWNKVENASLYEVYSNDTLVETTGDCFYICTGNSENKQLYVTAVDEESEKKSKESNKVMVYKQAGFSEYAF